MRMAGDPRDRPVTVRDLSVVVVVIFVGLFLTAFTVLGAVFLRLTPDGEFAFFLVVSVTFLGAFAGWSFYLEAGDRRWATARERGPFPPGGFGRPGSNGSEAPADGGCGPIPRVTPAAERRSPLSPLPPYPR